MDDELEDKLIYQTIVSHAKLMSKFMMSVSLNNYFSYSWRMFRLYILKPEVLLLSIFVFLLIVYLQNLDFRTRSIFKRIGLTLGESSTFGNIQLPSRNGNYNWEYNGDNVAVYAIQGRRPRMEDRFVVNENFENTGVSLYAIFDGHGGEFAADYAAKHLIDSLKTRVIEIRALMKEGETEQKQDTSISKPKVVQSSGTEDRYKIDKKPRKAIVQSDDLRVLGNNSDILDTDLLLKLEKVLPISKQVISVSKDEEVPIIDPKLYLENNGTINYNKLITDQVLATDKLLTEAAKKNRNIAGKKVILTVMNSIDCNILDTGGTTALIALIEKGQLIVANVGDSRGVMCDNRGNAIPLSFDHKPQQMREKKRIQEAGGFISFNGVWRVAGILATSRALGDYPLKDRNLVIAEPDILTFDLSNHKPQFLMFASDGLWDMFTNEEAVAYIRERLVVEPFFGAKSITLQAYYKGSLDNVTVLIINLSNHQWDSNF